MCPYVSVDSEFFFWLPLKSLFASGCSLFVRSLQGFSGFSGHVFVSAACQWPPVCGHGLCVVALSAEASAGLSPRGTLQLPWVSAGSLEEGPVCCFGEGLGV